MSASLCEADVASVPVSLCEVGMASIPASLSDGDLALCLKVLVKYSWPLCL